MRLLARRRGRGGQPCDCRLCRPGDLSDPRDRKAVADVQEYGVHIVLVSDSLPCTCTHHDELEHPGPTGEPDFAYTVGLWHQRRHPELLMSGLASVEVMHSTLNELAGLVRNGVVFTPGEVWEDVLRGVAVTVEELTAQERGQLTTWSAWFHRRGVPALQVLWPDMDGLFAWQGGDAVLDERQPPQWRVPSARTGALAPEPPWPFPVPSDLLAISCRHVAEGEAVALYVQRDSDPDRGEDWTFSCNEEHPEPDWLVLCHLGHLVVRSPGLREVADLGLGEWAQRADARSPWRRFRSEPDGG